MVASQNGHAAVVRRLLDAEADKDAKNMVRECTMCSGCMNY
jgi:hypothetical protein